MKTTMTFLAGAGLAAAAMTTLASSAQAVPVRTPFGDPFPADSFVIMSPSSPFSTPFGTVNSILLSGFGTNTPVDLGGDDYQYTDTTVMFTNDFLDGSGNKVGSFVGMVDPTGFVSVLSNRVPGFVSPGEFAAEITAATFVGDVFDLDGNVIATGFTTRVNPDAGFETIGTATFTGEVPDQLVETSFNVKGQFSEDGVNFTDTPDLGAVSNPSETPTTVPEPSAILGLATLGFGGFLKKKISNKKNKA